MIFIIATQYYYQYHLACTCIEEGTRETIAHRNDLQSIHRMSQNTCPISWYNLKICNNRISIKGQDINSKSKGGNTIERGTLEVEIYMLYNHEYVTMADLRPCAPIGVI